MFSLGLPPIWIGVLSAKLQLPGSRSLKARRQVLRSLRDRLRHRFAVSVHELTISERADAAGLVVSTAGQDPGSIRQTIDRIASVVDSHPSAVITSLDKEVFRWHPPGQDWADLIDDRPLVEDDGDG